MTTQEIIKQTETFTIDQKQELVYFFFSTLNEEKKQDFMQLFHYKKDFNNRDEKTRTNNVEDVLKKFKGRVKGVWENEDAQVYINKLREDDREF